MTNDIAVSVIIPVYNAAPYLRQCLDSVVNQTLQEIEIICVDDGSTDNSLDILREYERADSRVRVITQPHENAGVARNTGIDTAEGRYLYFFDADDFIERDAIETAVARAEETEADIVIFDGDRYDDKTKRLMREGIVNREFLPSRNLFSPEDVADSIFQFCYPAVWNKLFSRDFISHRALRFQSVIGSNDRLFNCVAVTCAGKIAVLDKRLIYHRVNVPSSVSSNYTWHRDIPFMVNIAIGDELRKRGTYDKFRRSLVNNNLSHALSSLERAAAYPDFEYVWRKLRDTWLDELDIAGHPREYFYSPWEYAWLRRIAESEPDEEAYLDAVISGGGNPILPRRRVQRGSSIVLYGAGSVGKRYYKGLSDTGYCDVALWVDRRAREFGSPVSEISEIVKAKYDHVVVAVSNPDVAREIAVALTVNYGVEPERLVYICE